MLSSDSDSVVDDGSGDESHSDGIEMDDGEQFKVVKKFFFEWKREVENYFHNNDYQTVVKNNNEVSFV
jgi:hypothetical protein